MAGHITWQPDGQIRHVVNPWGLWWQELTASDICVVDDDARVVGGRWDVTPAIHIHTELHRLRPDARVVIHNHPYYVSLSPPSARCPSSSTRPASLFLDDMYLVEEYDGEIDTPLARSRTGRARSVGQPGRSWPTTASSPPAQPRGSRVPGGVHRAGLPAGVRRDG